MLERSVQYQVANRMVPLRTSMMSGRMGHRLRGSATLGAAALLLLASGGLLVGYFVQVQSASAGSESPPAAAVEASTVGSGEAVNKAFAAFLGQEVALVFDGREVKRTWRQLGATLDPELVDSTRLSGDGQFVGTVPAVFDRTRATEVLTGLKDQLDRPAQNARMDLEARTVHRSVPGFGLDVFTAVSEMESAARRGLSRVDLPGAEMPAAVTTKELGIDNVSTVLASFKTRFSISEKSRNDNLKLVASRIDGHVIKPGEQFSFNEVVGSRTEREGYKTAHVILKGEMVDGMAGGACQISTTLHGAAFFAGLNIVESTPHSRPSTYVAMGLDATVVYPQVDLKLSNPYDFPVAVHYRVARGEAYVEILGKERPYDKIAFEREVDERIDFETITREDDSIAIGNMVVDQPGYPGYKVNRKRVFYKDGKVVKQNKWRLNYRPVVEYVRMGVSPNPNLAPPKQKKPHGPKPASGRFRMVQ